MHYRTRLKAPRIALGLGALSLLLTGCMNLPLYDGSTTERRPGSTTSSTPTSSSPEPGSSSFGSATPTSPGIDPAPPTSASSNPPKPAPPKPAPPPPIPGPPDPGNPPPAETSPVLGWLPVGPASPNDPPPALWYTILKDRDCERLDANQPDAGTVWAAAVPICFALETGDAATWAEAQATLGATPAPSDCLGAAAYAALTRVISTHRQNPSAQIQVAPSGGTACPLEFTGVESATCITVDGLTHVRLLGRFPELTGVTVGGVAVAWHRENENEYYADIPAGAPGTVTVVATGVSAPVPGTVSLLYVENLSECPA